jgi:UDP:flavonoid glycosyltransferase YjiC (YdhE family)
MAGLRIVFSTQPGHGHLNPLLPVARACQDAGHTVLFATAPRFCPTVQRHGFECRAAGMDYLWSEALESFPEIAQAPWGPEQARWLTEQVAFPRLVRPMAKDLVSLLEEFQPDLMVVDYADWGARLAADVAGIPYAACSWGFEADMDFSFAWNLYDDIRREFGLGPTPVHDRSMARWLRISPLPERWVRASAPSSPTTHRFAMGLHDAPPDATLPGWFDELDDRPLIYATMGTVVPIAPLIGWLIDGLSPLEANLVITTGRSFDPSSLGPLPANVHVERFIPQSLLLEHCALIVSHAGFGTVLGAMQHGVPMILLQLAADHWYNAERCGELGVARIVGRDARTPEGLRDLARDALADEELCTNADAMKAAFADLPDVSNAVPLMERLASEKVPVT